MLTDLSEAINYASRLASHQAAFATQMRGLAADLRSGKLTVDQWYYQSQIKVQGHVLDGYRLGLAKARGIAPSAVRLTPAERKAANAQIVSQYKYLAGFRDAVKARLATGKGLTSLVDARAALYAGASRDAYGFATMTEKPETRLTWRRHVADSCQTCIEQNGRTRTAAEWQAMDLWPAHNTACLSACRCSLEATV